MKPGYFDTSINIYMYKTRWIVENTSSKNTIKKLTLHFRNHIFTHIYFALALFYFINRRWF